MWIACSQSAVLDGPVWDSRCWCCTPEVMVTAGAAAAAVVAVVIVAAAAIVATPSVTAATARAP